MGRSILMQIGQRDLLRSAIALALALGVIAVVLVPTTASAIANGTYRDEFLTNHSYSGNDGTLLWSTDWLESGESDGPNTGLIAAESEPHCAIGNCLVLGKSGTNPQAEVEREADLDGAMTAVLTFDFKRHLHGAGSGQVELEAKNVGGGGWTVLQTWPINVGDPSQQSASFDILAFAAPDTRFRFRVSGSTDASHLNVDNLQIAATFNQAPVLDPVGDRVGDEGTLIAFTATASDPDVPANGLIFSLAGAPPGASITAGGDFTWIPTEAQGPGTYTLDVVATDDGTPNQADFETIEVTVDEVNIDVVADAIADDTIDEMLAYGFTATATDLDLPANILTWTMPIGPAGAAVTTGGAFTWTPAESQGPGAYAVTLRVNDGEGSDDEVDFTITVDEVNTAPVITDPGPRLSGEGDTISLAVEGSDSDLPANALLWAAVGLPTGLTIGPTGVISGVIDPLAAAGSPYSVTVTLTDDGTLVLDDAVAFSWTVVDSNQAPVLDPVGDYSGDEDTLIGFTATASDPDLPVQGLSLSLAGEPLGAAITAGGDFTWTPTEAQGAGVYTFDVVVTDDGVPNLASAETITITVTEVNVDVVANAVANPTIDEMVAYGFTATAVDPDLPANTLTWNLVSGPTGAAVTTGGAFSWTPTETQGPASHPVTLRVTDGLSTSDVSFTITVNEIVEPPPPVTPPPTPPPVEPPPPIEPPPVEPPAPPAEPVPPPDPVPEPEIAPIEPPSAVVTASARKEAVVEALSGFEAAQADTSERSIARTLVTMSGVTVAAVSSLGMPFFLLVGLGLMVATIGNVSIFPLIGRSRRRQGTVARFNSKTGYGFIVADNDSAEVFVHGESLRRRVQELAPGQRVSYCVIKGSHRDFALAVRTIEK